MNTQKAKPLRSGELAKLVGVSPDTLRLYERKGLIRRPPRASNGYRCYPADTASRILLIQAALSIGFTIDELAEILTLRDSGGAPCRRVRDLAGEKLERLHQHVEQLIRLRDQLTEILKQWDSALKKAPSSQRAGLLEALVGATSPVQQQLRPTSLHFNQPFHKEKQK